MALLSRKADKTLTPQADAARTRLVDAARWELVPLKSIEQAIADLPPASSVSVTCSPNKGIDTTLEFTARLTDMGHHAVPHFAARMVGGPGETKRLGTWLRDHGVKEIFVVGGDAPEPAGPYKEGSTFIADLLETDHGLEILGVPSYPEGHAMIDASLLHDALFAKQELITSAGLQGFTSTQMCFDTKAIVKWLEAERAAGLTLPVHLGIPGVVDRAKLLSLGTRVGIGASLRFLKKNSASLGRMMMPGGYDPSELLDAVAPHADRLKISGLHVFTFNNVGETVVWADEVRG
jgi:methylenetetrahydrofolate reductase (NADPH)